MLNEKFKESTYTYIKIARPNWDCDTVGCIWEEINSDEKIISLAKKYADNMFSWILKNPNNLHFHRLAQISRNWESTRNLLRSSPYKVDKTCIWYWAIRQKLNEIDSTTSSAL